MKWTFSKHLCNYGGCSGQVIVEEISVVRTNTTVQKNNPCPSRGPALTALPLLPGAQTIKISTQMAGISGKDTLNLCYKTFSGI